MQALVTCFLTILDKLPRVFPVVIERIIRHLLAKFVMLAKVITAMEALVNLSLCSGLGYSTEGAINDTLSEYRK